MGRRLFSRIKFTSCWSATVPLSQLHCALDPPEQTPLTPHAQVEVLPLPAKAVETTNEIQRMMLVTVIEQHEHVYFAEKKHYLITSTTFTRSLSNMSMFILSEKKII